MTDMPTLPRRSPADHYTRTARAAARTVMRSYSTSFTLASSALPRRIRTHIDAVYAMVRVADEVVDGAWPGASPEETLDELARFEKVIAQAVERGFSTDLIAHAFAASARATGIGPAQWEPFFASMRSDVPGLTAPSPPTCPPEGPSPRDAPSHRADHFPPTFIRPHMKEAVRSDESWWEQPEHSRALTDDELSRYIHGSAEVVGEMCVLAFFDGAPLPRDAESALLPGARALGSAFQKVNFVRDLAHDSAHLRRGYLVAPGRASTDFTEERKDRLVFEVFDELATAAPVIDELPRSVRSAVWTAFGVFAELNHRIAMTPAEQVARRRVRVPDPIKLTIAARATAGRPRTTWPGMPVGYSRRSA